MSEREIIRKLQEARGYWSSPRPQLSEVIRRWQEDGTKLLDASQPFLVEVRELWPLREFTWTRKDSRGSPEEWDALLASLKSQGWKKSDPLHLDIGQAGGVKVGEGNHRLAMARKMGIHKVPVWAHFLPGMVKKDPKRPPAPQRRKPPRKSKITREPDELDKKVLDLLGF